MPTNRIEALASAIASYNKFHDPKSNAFRLNNPGMLIAFGFRQLEESEQINGKFIRIFSNLVGGYRALWLDLELKCQGQRRGVSGTTLKDLLSSYRAGHDSALFEIIDFLRQSLGDESIAADTDLKYFVNELKYSEEINHGRES